MAFATGISNNEKSLSFDLRGSSSTWRLVCAKKEHVASTTEGMLAVRPYLNALRLRSAASATKNR